MKNGGSSAPGSTLTPSPMIFTKLSGAAIPRGSVVKFGADQNHVVVTASTGDTPVGIATSAATGAGQNVSIATLGGAATMIGSAAITHGALLEAGASGKVATMGAGVGVHQCVGQALQDCSGDGVSFTAQANYFIREI